MAIKAPSLQKTFTEHWSEDPSFYAPPDDAPPETIADYHAKIAAAIDTGNWGALRVEGAGEPTAFTVKPLTSDQLGKLADMKGSGAGENEWLTYALRCSLISVTNLGDSKVGFADDERFGRIASLTFLEQAGVTGAMGLRLVRELGMRALSRAMSLSGK